MIKRLVAQKRKLNRNEDALVLEQGRKELNEG